MGRYHFCLLKKQKQTARSGSICMDLAECDCGANRPHVHCYLEIFNGLGQYALADRPDLSFSHDRNPPGSNSTCWHHARLKKEMEVA